MTDAPKIDTQAPERIWVTGEDSIWPTFRSFNASDLDHRNDDGTSDYPEYERRDLADARAAAAAQAMREAALARAKDLPISEIAVDEVVYAIDRLPLPDTTALDRMIADRVREAFAALDECLEWMEQLRASGDAGFWEWQPGDAYNKGMALIARGSKEGQS